MAQSETLVLKKGERKTVAFETTVELPYSDPYVLVRARVLDPTGRKFLSESAAWLPYSHEIPLKVKTDKKSYVPGERLEVTVTASKEAAVGEHAATLYLVDHAGRALQKADGKLAVAAGQPGTWPSQLPMPDWGPKFVGSYWLTAVARREGRIVGTATVQILLDQPWNMREQFQWSLWTYGGPPRKMALVHDAGFNTFGVTIDHDNWNDVRAAMVKRISSLEKGGPDARSKSLVSLGEESGFKGGWGRRYYWEKPEAPALVQRVFDQYLSDRYDGEIDALNREWGTSYASFDQIPLEKAKARNPGRLFVTSQAWEAMQKKGEKKNVFPVEVRAPDPRRRYLAHSAPYLETYRFFDWYYQKYCDLATEVYRSQRNPVPLTIMSAPGGFYPKVDVYNFAGQGPFYPKEMGLVGNAAARRDYDDIPGFSAAMWAYFDLRSLWSCTVLSSILAGNTHLDYWVDVPLTFNADVTHTRASFWTKVLRQELRPVEPILLHKRFAYTAGLGLYLPPQPLSKGVLGRHFGSAISPNAPVYSALEKSGYLPRVVPASDLGDVEVLIASYAQVVSPEDGKRLREFVERGGTLIATPWLGSCSPHGNMLTVYPSKESGLAGLLGFRLLNTSQELRKEEVRAELKAHFGIEHPLSLLSKGRDQVLDLAADVRVLARYRDATPLLLTRRVGKGRVIYLNMVYDWNSWWNSFYEPPREAYRQLIAGILRSDARVRNEYSIGFRSAEAVTDNKGWWGMVMKGQPQPGESIPWWASQLYADPSGHVKYLAVFSDHRSPKIDAFVHVHQKNAGVFDLMAGEEIAATAGGLPLSLRPGEAALWAVGRWVPNELRLTAPNEVRAGDPIKIGLKLPGADRDVLFGAVVDVYSPSGSRSRDHSLAKADLQGGQTEVAIPTAFNDPLGEYRIVATECITRVKAEGKFSLVAAEAVPDTSVLNPFPKRGSEAWPDKRMASAEFLAHLRRLREIYLADHQGLEAKYALSFYLNVPFRPNNRHAVLRRLHRTDWKPHLAAVREAIKAGETFYLLGEDLNTDPLTGLAIDPLAVADIRTFVDALAKTPDASRRAVQVQGTDFDLIRIGAGSLAIGNASVDRSAYHSSDFVVWHGEVKRALASLAAGR